MLQRMNSQHDPMQPCCTLSVTIAGFGGAWNKQAAQLLAGHTI